MGKLDSFRTTSGKRLRDPEEFIKAQGDDPVCFVVMYNKRDKLVMKAWKNMKTKRTHITELRPPTNVEEEKYGKLLRQQQILQGKDMGDQLELVVKGDKYEKKELKSK